MKACFHRWLLLLALLPAGGFAAPAATLPNAWQVADTATSAGSLYFTNTLSAAQKVAATNSGWQFSVVSRLVAGSTNTSPAQFMTYGHGNRRFIVGWDTNAAGQFTATFYGSPNVTSILSPPGAAATNYHRHELVYDPSTVTATYLFDGASIHAWAGLSGDANYNGQAMFGAAAGGGQGRMNFHQVEFAINGLGTVSGYLAGFQGSPAIAPNPTSQGWTLTQSPANPGVTNFPVSPDGVLLPPFFTACPASVDATVADGVNSRTVTWATPDAIGTPAPVVACVPLSGSVFPVGSTLVTCTAANNSGTNTCRFPVIVCATNIVVTSTADSGAGSLRAAVSNACPGGIITFAPSLNGQTIVLTSGQLFIAKNLSILGPGAASLAISGNNNSRVFSISHLSVTCILAGLTITNGNGAGPDIAGSGDGGGIKNEGTLTVSTCDISGNSCHSGGAIANWGTLTVHSCSLRGNVARSLGGAIYNRNTFETPLTIYNSALIGNSAGVYGGGIFSLSIPGFGSGAMVSVQGSTLSGNFATNAGGAIYNNDSLLSVQGSTLSSNWSLLGGGIFCEVNSTGTVQNCTLHGNWTTLNGYGGGIFNQLDSRLTVQDSTLSANAASVNGGGIYNDFNSTVTVQSSTLSGNSATNGGGGIWNNPTTTLTIRNSTVSGNSADGGGGILNDTGTLTVENSTFHGNRARIEGGGLYAAGMDRLTNCIVAGNFKGSGSTPSDIESFDPVDGAAFNLIGSTNGVVGITHGVNGNIVGNAGVGTLPITSILNTNLASNGGPTRTHALVPGSLALDAGTNAASLPVTDQRGPGYSRRVGLRVDMGAFEVQAPLRITQIVPIPAGILLRVQGASSESLQIQWNGNPGFGGWNLLANGTTDGAGLLEYTNVGVGTLPRRFYRAVRP